MKVEIKNRMKPCLIVSLAIMAVALVMTLTGNGLNLGVDFTGGTLMTYSMGGQFEVSDVEAALAANGVTDAQIAKLGDNTEVQIRIKDQENTDVLRDALEKALSEKYPDIHYVDISRVGAIAGRDLVSNAVKSVCIASLLMLVYIAIRFDFFMGLAAVLGLLHDVLVMLSFTVLLRGMIRVETTYIAALLTIVGYSINNTIIIFDRIRENMRSGANRARGRVEVVNMSISQSLSRTLNTTVTTLLTVVTLYVLGVNSIKQFALPLIIGILAGTYSANMINGYLWATFMDLREKKKA